MSTGFKRPYPGETKVRPPSDFNNPAPAKADLDDNKTRSDCNCPLPDRRGEGFLFSLRCRVPTNVNPSRDDGENTPPVDFLVRSVEIEFPDGNGTSRT